MGNNITTAPERSDGETHSSTSSIGGSRVNNDQRNASSVGPSIVSFSFRRTGLLGLSKTELDQRCQPSGLYKSCSWDDRTIRRLIADGKLAARLVGTDHDESFLPKASQPGRDSSTAYLHECPICFLHYAQVNVATCCAASICTECYLQVHPPKEKNVTCPFCNNSTFDVQVAKQLDEEYVLQREEEEQKVIESTIRARSGLIMVSDRTNTTTNDKDTPDGSVDSITVADSSFDTSIPDDEFGSNLVKRLRARTESLTARDLNHDSVMTISPEERRQLELEMKDQKSHPLVRMLELEAEETCHRHELEHSERVSRNIFFLRGSLGRRLVQQSENSGNAALDRIQNESISSGSQGNRGDGLSMLETALLIAMEERSLRDRTINSGLMNIDESDSSYADAMALLQELLSRRQQLRERQSSSGSRANQRRLGLEAQLETATNMLLSILPEEDQIAMAMAMSLGEANRAHDDTTSNGPVEDDVVHDMIHSTVASEVVDAIPETMASEVVGGVTPVTGAEIVGVSPDFSERDSCSSNDATTSSLSSSISPGIEAVRREQD